MKSDGSTYKLEDLYKDQQFLVGTVIEKLHEWIHCKKVSDFKPLRLTINGAGGCGKSVVINTLVTIIRNMFKRNDVVKVCAPTGPAAANVGGTTMHRLAKMSVNPIDYIPNSMSDDCRKEMVKALKNTIAIIIDERSLINNRELGTMERKIAETIHEGGHRREEIFGGLPILILVGDDHQLPGTGEGAMCALTKRGDKTMADKGRKVLRDCAKHVLELKTSRRITGNKAIDKQLIEKIRVREALTEAEVSKLLNLHIDKLQQRITKEEFDEIKAKAMYLFYRNKPRIRHNLQMIYNQHSSTNPIAVIRAKSTGSTGRGIKSHFKQTGNRELPDSVMLCIGATVALEGKNYCPEWGLYNGALGYVREIIFAKGQSPNNGDRPEYVVVEFPGYTGPTWDTNNEKVRRKILTYYDFFDIKIQPLPHSHLSLSYLQLVPIPTISIPCNNRAQCCHRTWLPLVEAYARTIHKFQGQTAGPVDIGRAPNMFDVIICDPDKHEYEGLCMGLFYTALSRATTLGDERGNKSAIYFMGKEFRQERFRNLGKMKGTDEDYECFKKRDRWVAHLKANTRPLEPITPMMKEALEWATNTIIDYDVLYKRILWYTGRAS